jgi:hypothetical protein
VQNSEHHCNRVAIVRRSELAVSTQSTFYLGVAVDKRGWTLLDHDVRFVAQLSSNWMALDPESQLNYRCRQGYLLQRWLRMIYRSAKNITQTGTGKRWYPWLLMLFGTLENTSSAPLTPMATSHEPSTPSSREPATITSLSPESIPVSLASLEPTVRDPSDAASAVAPVPRRHPTEFPGSSLRLSSDANPAPTTAAISRPRGHHEQLALWDLPELPSYPASVSKVHALQPFAVEWLLESGRDQFMRRQERLLSSWGVAPDHAASCVLIPADWGETSAKDLTPNHDGHLQSSTIGTQTRLEFSLVQHKTYWGRASAWFNGFPRRGADLDNFLHLDRAHHAPMQGSHLCHQGDCIVPAHLIYEPTFINLSRVECYRFAHGLRGQGLAVPSECQRHTPACLLQLAALMPAERLSIQLDVYRQSRGLATLPPPTTPADHPFSTFEAKMPVQFPCTGTTELPWRLTDVLTEGGDTYHDMPRLQFVCCFCLTRKVYSNVTPYWRHIYKLHQVVPEDQRLQAIRDSAQKLREHREEYVRIQGSSHGPDTTTRKRVEQAGRDDFGWQVVEAWFGPPAKRSSR